MQTVSTTVNALVLDRAVLATRLKHLLLPHHASEMRLRAQGREYVIACHQDAKSIGTVPTFDEVRATLRNHTHTDTCTSCLMRTRF